MGKTGFEGDVAGRSFFCNNETPEPLLSAENLRLFRRGPTTGCGWEDDWHVGGVDGRRVVFERRSVVVIIDAFLPSALSRGYGLGL